MANRTENAAASEGKPKTGDDDVMAKLESSTRLPDKMMRILLKSEAPDAIWWLSKGESFAIQKDRFEGEILLKYFRGNKFKSLVRNLHRWGFRRTTFEGDTTGKTVAFSHPNFRQDKPELVFQIDMTNEIKGKKQEQKTLLGKRQVSSSVEEGTATRFAKASRVTSEQKSTETPRSSPLFATLPGQPGKTTGLENPAQQTGMEPPTMQSFARHAASLRSDQSNFLAGYNALSLSLPHSSLADAATLEALRATREFRLGYVNARRDINQQLREQIQNEQSFLHLLAPPQRPLPSNVLLQREIDNCVQNGLARSSLNASILQGSGFGPLFSTPSEAAATVRQPHATMQQLLRRQQLNETILQGQSPSPTARLMNLFQGSNAGGSLQPFDHGAPPEEQKDLGR